MNTRVRVLITGANRGIGKAIAELYRQTNYDVLALDRSIVDLRYPESVAAYIGTIDPKPLIVINNAGINPLNLIENISSEDAVATMNIMYHSPLALIKACVPTMKSHSFGRIVNIGSIWSVVSKPGRLVYSSAKHALDGITNTLAVELAPNGILVNTVCPGFTDTEMTSQNNTPEEIAALCQSIPLGRLARPQEIAGLVHFLGSERNTYITGQKITIDGGFTCA